MEKNTTTTTPLQPCMQLSEPVGRVGLREQDFSGQIWVGVSLANLPWGGAGNARLEHPTYFIQLSLFFPEEWEAGNRKPLLTALWLVDEDQDAPDVFKRRPCMWEAKRGLRSCLTLAMQHKPKEKYSCTQGPCPLLPPIHPVLPCLSLTAVSLLVTRDWGLHSAREGPPLQPRAQNRKRSS